MCLFTEIVVSVNPFCDHPMGPRLENWFHDLPTTTLKTFPELLERAFASSHPDPRPTNPNGRSADRGKDIEYEVCSQHQYETFIIPLSIELNWPRNIEFQRLGNRCRSPVVWERLVAVYQRPWTSVLVGKTASETYNDKELRKSLVFELRPSAGYYGTRG